MGTYEAFEANLRKALTHLYDPAYRPEATLRNLLRGSSPELGQQPLQTIIQEAIKALKPPPDAPASARSWRVYEVLSYRYVKGLTQVETAQRLAITPRHLRREQKYAVSALAQHLWERNQQNRQTELAASANLPQVLPAGSIPTWETQVRADLASLQEGAPGVMANVKETITGAISLGLALAAKHEVTLEAVAPLPDVSTSIHPMALRQILLTAIEKLVQSMTTGTITLEATQLEGQVAVTIEGQPFSGAKPPSSDFIRETLAMEGGSGEIRAEGDRVSFQLILPEVVTIKVLVVDDNLDLVHFYRRFTAKTRYEITHMADGTQLFETIEAAPPDIIVLDVMLPDVDGWELLTQIHEHPDTRTIPVVVCSVVRREELALVLGAVSYIPKPVRRKEFIQALDSALDQRSTSNPRIQARNESTY